MGGYGGGMGGYGGGMSGARGGMGGGFSSYSSVAVANDNDQLQMTVAPLQTVVPLQVVMQPPAEMTATMATKYASLDIEIPQTGTVYLFTAPQAENRLSVSGISNAASQRVRDLGYVTLLLAVCTGIGFVVMRRKKS